LYILATGLQHCVAIPNQSEISYLYDTKVLVIEVKPRTSQW